ncbi:MAG: DUF3343 domain-containing protein [Bacteroidales bacterium]|nr:DUF3343 domain-containing protein [Porphyromonas sp.]MDD6934579.1 DUF3343 domain-containing protein [Bacteroidales bacterium]MDY3101847.1 DUF3343 domain-containing protein [Porphyromonas sp.]
MYSDSVLILFGSTRLFVRALALCEGEGLEVRVLSVPDAIMAGCGMCLGLTEPVAQRAISLLRQAQIAGKVYTAQTFDLIQEWNETTSL